MGGGNGVEHRQHESNWSSLTSPHLGQVFMILFRPRPRGYDWPLSTIYFRNQVNLPALRLPQAMSKPVLGASNGKVIADGFNKTLPRSVNYQRHDFTKFRDVWIHSSAPRFVDGGV